MVIMLILCLITKASLSMHIVKAEMIISGEESHNQNPCTSLLVSDSMSGKEAEGSVLRFPNVDSLLRVEDGTGLVNILDSVSCARTIAHVSSDNEASEVIDLVAKFRMAQKYLTIVNPKLNVNYLQNKTINFNVELNHLGLDGRATKTSLCPSLGRIHAEPYIGPCPKPLQNPSGKELKISFIGGEPYIKYNPIGGSDFLVVKILAEKFGFIPKFMPERSYDIVKNNETTYGMLFRVSSKQSELGIGQPNFAHYRYMIVDYLPAMSMYEYIMGSKKPEEIATYDTIIYPFDAATWLFTICSILSELLLLILAQNLWSFIYKSKTPNDYIYEDFFLSTGFIPTPRLNRWIQRPGLAIRKAMILKWIILGSLLSMAYKSTLLSSLIPVRYEATIDTLEDMEQSGRPLLIMRSTTFHKLIVNDPREAMRRAYERSILYQMNPTEDWGVPGWIMAMFENGTAVLTTYKDVKHMRVNIDHYSKETLLATHSSFILPKGSPLVGMFSTTTMWLRDTGILNKLKYDVMNPPIPIPDAKVRLKQPLNLWQLAIVMIILLVGLNVALVVFLLEVGMRRKKTPIVAVT